MENTDVHVVIDHLKKVLLTDNVRMRISYIPELTQGSVVTQSVGQADVFNTIESPFDIFEQDGKKRGTLMKRAVVVDEVQKPTGVMNDLFLQVYPDASLLIGQSFIDKFVSFKTELAENLTNINQLAKKFGYTRRKTFDVGAFQHLLTSLDFDTSVKDDKVHDVVDYFAKLLKMRAIILPDDELTRFDFEPIDNAQPDKYLLVTPGKAEILTTDVANQRLLNNQSLKAVVSKGICNMNVQALREASRFLGIYEKGMVKTDMIKALTKATTA